MIIVVVQWAGERCQYTDGNTVLPVAGGSIVGVFCRCGRVVAGVLCSGEWLSVPIYVRGGYFGIPIVLAMGGTMRVSCHAVQ